MEIQKGVQTKVLIKLLNENKNTTEWVHVCYVDADLYNKYISHFDLTTQDLNTTIARWIKEDFNLTMVIGRKADLQVAKGIIQDYYRRVYPDIYMESDGIDRQGWMRVYVQKKMKEDLGIYGE